VSIEISAIVCTHNRAGSLPQALESLAHQTLPEGRYEVLVVDNASTDATPRMLRELAERMPQLRSVSEPRLGCSRARNTGWRQARGRYVAYLDDDAVADPEWLERMLHALRTLRPRPGAVGGRIEPIWEVPRPEWLPDSVLGLLTTLDHAPEPLFLPAGRFLIGTNIAYPREVLEELGGYHELLGPVGERYRAGEETLLQRELRAHGYAIYYDPAILVRHRLPASRLDPRWLRRRMYWEGLSRAHVELLERAPTLREHLRMLRAAGHKVVSSPRRLAALALPVRRRGVFRRQASSMRRIGYLMGLLGADRRLFRFASPLAGRESGEGQRRG